MYAHVIDIVCVYQIYIYIGTYDKHIFSRRMKRKTQQKVTAAIILEKKKEIQRKKVELNTNDNIKLKEVKQMHNEERHKFRIYLRTTQYDSEVMFIKKMREYELLW